MAKRDYYEILGVPKSASADEIKRAHRKLVRQHHPDVNKNEKASEEKFKEAQEAYDVLSDDAKRQKYDQFGHAGVNADGGGGAGGDPFEALRRGAGGGRRGGATVEQIDPRDFSNGGDFGDIFEQFFGARGGVGGGPAGGGRRAGGRAGRHPPPPPDRGADLEHAVTLTFEQAARGVTLPLQVSRDGRLETIDIKIPAGVKDGSKVRLKGRGQHVAGGGEPGDLYIVTAVRPHDLYRRDGLDVLVDVPVSVYEALLGAKVVVPTLDGPVTLTLPPGTNSGAKLRVKGRGAVRGAEKGDQLCLIKVVMPKDLGEPERELVRQIEAARPVDARPDPAWAELTRAAGPA